MTEEKENQLRGILQTLAHISYTALIEVRQLQGVDESKIEVLKEYKQVLEDLILKTFDE